MKGLLAAAIVMALGAYAGIRYEVMAIQDTCDAEEAHTFINGTDYVCVSAERVERAREREQGQRGA
jgi:hypothetical protein